jgi:hypothetical protein|tara:strand:+ start:266 stop:727 length:462 start_codon:yes stop_codon:yes gene_type:complete
MLSPATDSAGIMLAYEREADPNFNFIPLVIRMNLDLAGVRISLDDWQALSFEQRTTLIHAASDRHLNSFKDVLNPMLEEIGRTAHTAEQEVPMHSAEWLKSTEPDFVERFNRLARLEANWQTLNCFERYVLCYTAKKGDQELCQRAMKELIDS